MAMTENKSKPEVLANWKYEPNLWRDFLEYESGIYKGSVRAAKHLFFGVLVFTIVVVFLIVFITLLVTDKWNLEILSPAIAFGLIGWIFIVITGVFWLYRRNNWNQFNQRTGEVSISFNEVKKNGVSFSWDYEAFGVRFDKVERKTVSVKTGKTFEILEFHTVNYIKISDGRTREDFECRVPIPFGKESEAETIMNRLRARLLAADQEWIKENFALGHEFSLGVCRKCGEPVAESAAFSCYKCRNKK